MHGWQLVEPISGVIFDCDGTLSSLEGIDVLADMNNVGPMVKEMTAAAMREHGINPEMYWQRLTRVQPTQSQVLWLGDAYFNHCIPDAMEVITILKRLKKTVHIVSSGLDPAVKRFAHHLGIPSANVFAVPIYYDAHGNFLDFDRTSPLVQPDGKRCIVNEITKGQNSLIYIGDGVNDLDVCGSVKKFIGFGGITYRERVARMADYYIKVNTMAPLLPLALTKHETKSLETKEYILYQKGANTLAHCN